MEKNCSFGLKRNAFYVNNLKSYYFFNISFFFFFFFFPVDICVVKSFAYIMLELLSELLFIVYQYYYYYFSFFSSLNKRFPSIIKQAGLIFLYNCNYNNCYCNCECLVYIYSLVAFNVYTLKNDKKKFYK